MLSSLFAFFSPCSRNKPADSDPGPNSRSDDVSSANDVQGVIKSDAAAAHSGCIFCNTTRERGFRVVYEDEAFVVFRDHKPAAAHHLLVVPRRHIDSVRTLGKEDAAMVARMAEVAHNVLDELKVPVGSRRLGFHIPPFYSVKHLHLHVLAAPYASALARAKYPVVRGWAGYDKGFSWFVEAEQAVAVLEKGGRVKISSC